MNRNTRPGQLDQAELHHILEAAGRAPSTHNSQPWIFRVHELIDVVADVRRRLPVVDPDDRELRISCGAALFNLELAARCCRRQPFTVLLPDAEDPQLMASVALRSRFTPTPALERLHRALWQRRTNRRPFLDRDVPTYVRSALRDAATAAGVSLQFVDGDDLRTRIRDLIRSANRRQESNPDFHAEMARWTGSHEARADGIPAFAGRVRPELQDEWVLRDFAGPGTPRRLPGKDFEARPAIAVLSSTGDTPFDQLRTGHALQQILLEATASGISASFISQPVEVPDTRLELRRLFGEDRWPQLILRLGYGFPVVGPARRSVSDTSAWPPTQTSPV